MTRVMVRSKKYRSCEMATTVPLNVERYCSSHSMACRSKWFVGSSRSKISVSSKMRRPRFTRVFSPPESVSNRRSRISGGMERPFATLLMGVSVS